MGTITVRAVRRSLDPLREFAAAAAAEAGLGVQETAVVILAVEEACSNVIDHAYAGVGDGEIEVCCDARAGELTIRIRDRGAPFDITTVRAPVLGPNLDERPVGGLGVHLIRELMDEVRFESSAAQGNLLTLVKRASGKS